MENYWFVLFFGFYIGYLVASLFYRNIYFKFLDKPEKATKENKCHRWHYDSEGRPVDD